MCEVREREKVGGGRDGGERREEQTVVATIKNYADP